MISRMYPISKASKIAFTYGTMTVSFAALLLAVFPSWTYGAVIRCDSHNRDPCTKFPGLCSEGGGLCVIKGPCEYECVCPPDGRRGRDCSRNQLSPNQPKDVDPSSENVGGHLESLLVFPKDLFWDLNHVAEPMEKITTPRPPPSSGWTQPASSSVPSSGGFTSTADIAHSLSPSPSPSSSASSSQSSTIMPTTVEQTMLTEMTSFDTSGGNTKSTANSLSSTSGTVTSATVGEISTSKTIPTSALSLVTPVDNLPSSPVTTKVPVTVNENDKTTVSSSSNGNMLEIETAQTLPSSDGTGELSSSFTPLTTDFSNNSTDEFNNQSIYSAEPAQNTANISLENTDFQLDPTSESSTILPEEFPTVVDTKSITSEATNNIPQSPNLGSDIISTQQQDQPSSRSTIPLLKASDLSLPVFLGTRLDEIDHVISTNSPAVQNDFPGHEMFPTFFSGGVQNDKTTLDKDTPNAALSFVVQRVFHTPEDFSTFRRGRQ